MVKPEKFFILLITGTILLVPAMGINNHACPQQRSQAQVPNDVPSISLDSDLVVVPVTVSSDNGGFVEGLQQEYFQVYDEQSRQKIVFFSHEEQPASVGLILDLSGSMAAQKISAARQAIRELVERGNPDNEFFVIGFNERPKLLRDFTSSAEEIVASIASTGASGRTAIYDAVSLGLGKVMHGRYVLRALVLISDGEDNSSGYTYRQLKQLAKERDSLIYCIGTFQPWETPPDVALGWQRLKALADLSGGRAFAIARDNPGFNVHKILISTCQLIATELRTQYSIGFYPTGAGNDGKWHRLKVFLKPLKGHGHVEVRFRRGYMGSQRLPQ